MSQLAKTYELSRIPLYLQVATTLRRRIEEGRWRPGEKISTLDELQAEFQVARVTIRQAVDLLQKEGLVLRQQGKGTFVVEEVKDRRWLKLATDWASLNSTIEQNVPKFISPRGGEAPEPNLHPEDGQHARDYVFLRSVQTREGQPYGVVNLHLARYVFEMAPEAFRSHTALPIVAKLDKLRIAAAHQTLVIGTADTETAALLKLPLNAPIAEAHCVVIDDKGVAIYIADIVYRGDCIKLSIDLLDSAKA